MSFSQKTPALPPLILAKVASPLSKDLVLEGSVAAPPGELTAAGLFHEHAAYAWRLLRRLGVDEVDVDDVCQEVFLTAHRRLPTFEGRSSARTWVYGICIRVAADHRKRTRARREVPSDAPPEQPVEARQDEDVALRQARARLDRILDTLDHEKRAAFVLYEIEDLSLREIASALGCPLQTAYSRLQSARQHVKDALDRLRAKERTP